MHSITALISVQDGGIYHTKDKPKAFHFLKKLTIKSRVLTHPYATYFRIQFSILDICNGFLQSLNYWIIGDTVNQRFHKRSTASEKLDLPKVWSYPTCLHNIGFYQESDVHHEQIMFLKVNQYQPHENVNKCGR